MERRVVNDDGLIRAAKGYLALKTMPDLDQPLSPEAQRLVDAVRRYGNDPRDLRDAAHEACHALELDVPRGDWDRETIHEAIMLTHNRRSSSVTRSFQLARIIGFEVTARAVERIVCDGFNVDIGDASGWMHIAYMEAMQGAGIRLPSVDWLLEQVEKAAKTDRVKKLVDRIVGLGDEKLVKPLKPAKRGRRRA